MLIAQKTHDFFDEHGGKKNRSKRYGGCPVIAPSLRNLCKKAARVPHDFRWETERVLHNFHPISEQPIYGFCQAPRGPIEEMARCL